MRHASNCFLIDSDGRVLLSMKKRGFGVGKWNGAGGKLQPNESPEDAAVREIAEEIGVIVASADLQKVGEINYSKPDDPNWGMFVHIFLVRTWAGEPTESEEMKPQWFQPNEILYDQSWQDLKHWLPRVLAGEKIRGNFVYQNDGEQLKDFSFS